MARKQKEEPKIEEIQAPLAPLSPLLSNVVAVIPHADWALLDFGFAAPAYREPHEIEDCQIARICLPWDTVEFLARSLTEAISAKEKKTKQRKAETKK
jgi:hypothetical protein